MNSTRTPIGAWVLFPFLLLVTFSAAWAEDTPAGQSRPASPPSRPIQDNSFLIEEAYNQERGVVQHISSFSRSFEAGGWSYLWTQEWPLGGDRHQLSYSLEALRPDETQGAGWGDLALHYRYQLFGSAETRTAFSPRVSLMLPTGDHRSERGLGGPGIQANLPLSIEIGSRFVTHWNAGATFVHGARNALDQKASAAGFNLGQSWIWLARPRFNVMMEVLWTGSESVLGPDRTRLEHELLIAPGVRWAHNLRNGLQIVPGIAVPIGAGPSRGKTGLILYLSLEHPFSAAGR